MRKRLQGLIAGVLIGAMLTGGVTFAKQISETAELLYDNIKISLNGQEIQPKDANGNYVEPFIINGTTYLPVRAVANALDIHVDWDGNTNTVILSNQESGNSATGFDASTVAKEISVIKEYQWKTNYGQYVGIVLKNNSNYTISPRVQLSFKDKEGKVVGAKSQSEHAFGSGNEMAFVFRCDDEFESYEYVISAGEEKYYKDCVSQLECTQSVTNEKAIIQIKNNGNKEAKFVQYIVLFKNNGNVVDYDWGYCVDDDSEIKPGMTEMEECSVAYGKSFDSIEVYLTGRADK